ncbi:MAG: hypothetical protein HZB18_15315 [Chloroflexi bacterium]|nr:hypothetical protein [Chloroflexota bacterium]
MKKLSFSTLLALCSALLVITAALAAISNGNFETGDFTGWIKSTFINNGFSASHGVGGTDLSVIVGTSGSGPLSFSDGHTSGNLLYPAYGDYSARVNSDASYSGGGFAKNANIITQTVSAALDPSDSLSHIRFTYAAVMVDPVATPHTAEEKPYFRVRVINTSNGNDVIYDFSSYVNEPGKNWQDGPTFSGSDSWKYINWQYVDLVSSVAHPVNAGDNITIEITAAGCSLGGHPGYVYVDEITDGNIAGPAIQAAGPATIETGTTITYTYTYHNGSGSSINPTITATQPTGVTFTSVSDAVNCVLSSGTVTCNYTGVSAGTNGSFTIDGTVTAPGGSQIAHGNYNIAASGFPTVGGPTVLTDVTDSTPVTVTINQSVGQVDPTNTRLLSFTAVFSEAVSGFDSSDVNESFNTNCAPTVNISGSGTTYTVTFLEMTKECTATVTIPGDAAESVGRPGVFNQASTSTDNSQRFQYIRKYYFSLPASDGWVLESTSTANLGGSMNSSDITMSAGDDVNNRDYRFFSRFDTRPDPLPAEAVIAAVNYRVKQVSVTGTNPLTTHGDFITELNKPYFGNSSNLELIDFQNRADQGACNFETTILVDGFYRCVFFKTAINQFPRNGVIDLRSRFELDDTDGVSDLLTVYSGNYAFQFSRPELFVAYYFLPTP